MEKKLLDIEDKVSEATIDLKKAAAIFSSLMNDMNFEKSELNETDLHYIAFAFDNLSHRGYAVIDYLNSSIEKLDSIHV